MLSQREEEKKGNVFNHIFNLDLSEHFSHYFMAHIRTRICNQSEFCFISLKISFNKLR